MSFIEMWQEADLVDYATGGLDNIPEWELDDYAASFFWNVRAEIREHLATTDKEREDA